MQCCGGGSGPAVLYNRLKQECCRDGTTALAGNCDKRQPAGTQNGPPNGPPDRGLNSFG